MSRRLPALLLALLLGACAAPPAPESRLQLLQQEQQRLNAERLRLERARAEARQGAEQALWTEQLRQLELRQLRLRAQIAEIEAGQPR